MNGANQLVTGDIGNTNSLQNFNVTNGTTTLDRNLTATNTNINNNSTLALNNSTVNSAIKTDGTGNLSLSGINDITGDVGEISKQLNNIEALANSNTTFNNNIYANNINLNTNSILDSKGNITSNVNGAAVNTGTLNISGPNNQVITGNIGTIENLNLNSGRVVRTDGDVNATNTNINSNSTLELVSGKNIDSVINGNTGNLTLLGTSTISEDIQS